LPSSSFRITRGEGFAVPNVESEREREVGTVRTGLVPAPITVNSCLKSGRIDLLDSGTNGTQNDGEEEGFRLTPFVEDFVANSFLFEVFQTRNRLESRRILCDQGALDQQLSHLGQFICLGESLDIADDLLLCEMGERILDSKTQSEMTNWLVFKSIQGRNVGVHVDILRRYSTTLCMIDFVVSARSR
jgi:hypothetical protein